MFDRLDPLLQTPLRLAIVSILVTVEKAEFVYLKDQIGATAGNLSVQISKLEEAKYLKVVKSFRSKKPVTTCTILAKGKKAFIKHFEALSSYIPRVSEDKTSSSSESIFLKWGF